MQAKLKLVTLLAEAGSLATPSMEFNGLERVFMPVAEYSRNGSITPVGLFSPDGQHPSAVLAPNLMPLALYETLPSGEEVRVVRVAVDPAEWVKSIGLKLPDEYADISGVDTSMENKMMWRELPEVIKSVITALMESGKLTWEDVLEDGTHRRRRRCRTACTRQRLRAS